MHAQRLFLQYAVPNSGKRYWDCKLYCIEAQIELSSTFVYDHKMSTSGSSARNSHLSQGGRMTMMPMSVNRSVEKRIGEQIIIIIEGRPDKNFKL